jgi:hypothetical protein
MRHRGMSDDEIAVGLLAVNTKRCTPPLPENEVVTIARDVAFRYQPAPRDPEQERIENQARGLLEGKPAGRGKQPRSELWEEPVPLAARGAASQFEITLLPEWLGGWAAAITAEKGAALDLGANLALGVISRAIARNVQVSPRPGWYEPTNLYELIALDPGQASSRCKLQPRPDRPRCRRARRALSLGRPHDTAPPRADPVPSATYLDAACLDPARRDAPDRLAVDARRCTGRSGRRPATASCDRSLSGSPTELGYEICGQRSLTIRLTAPKGSGLSFDLRVTVP